ncbi:MAG: hypothetical protein IJZ64_08930 [Ruminococcus sp.]|nr:hypothetical protein [Ruminococcus sp.]
MKKFKLKKENKIISLYKYHKSRFIESIIMVLGFLFALKVKNIYIARESWLKIPVSIILIFLIIYTTISIIKFFTTKAEKMDELANENMNKAHSQMGGIIRFIIFILLIVAIIKDLFLHDSININLTLSSDTLIYIYLIFFNSYFALESGLFILNEGREYEIDEDNNE